MSRKCVVCQASLEDKKPTAKFCSRACEGEHYRTRDGKINPIRNISCEVCKGAITTRNNKRRFCSRRCKATQYRESRQQVPPRSKVVPATTGTVSELRVAADLLLKGHAVFRALSPSCACDLVVLAQEGDEWRLYRIEVTTGYAYQSGGLYYPKHDPAKYDILAVVVAATGAIHYSPDLPIRPACAPKPTEVCGRGL